MTWAIAIGVGLLCCGFFGAGLLVGRSSMSDDDLVEQWRHTRRELDRACSGADLFLVDRVQSTAHSPMTPPAMRPAGRR